MVAGKMGSTSLPIAAKCGIDALIIYLFVCPADNLCVVSEHIGTLLPLYVAVASIGTGNRHDRHWDRHSVLHFCNVKKVGGGFVYTVTYWYFGVCT